MDHTRAQLRVVGARLGTRPGLRRADPDATSAGQRAWWGLLAAWALGGTAIWAMHFMAMLGFAVGGTRIRYDVPLTAASTAIAVAAVGIGLAIVGTGRLAAPRLLAGGFFTGAGWPPCTTPAWPRCAWTARSATTRCG
ncbi:MHYT domain-containing protein [Micromonospora sp. BRA006-A]|nr:MHYT domain-containing protein [Micromonospora sp. BRA006-A]